MLSPIILIVFLLAPTVPSEPKPKNTSSVAPSNNFTSLPTGILKCVTSSSIPTVNLVWPYLSM